MRQFKDMHGREYNIILTLRTFKKFRDVLGIDMLTFSDQQMIDLSEDPIRMIDMIYVAIREQCDAANITDTQFGESLQSEEATAAVMAFFRAYADFCPRVKRDALNKYLDAAEAMQAKQEAAMETLLSGDTSTDSQD